MLRIAELLTCMVKQLLRIVGAMNNISVVNLFIGRKRNGLILFIFGFDFHLFINI